MISELKLWKKTLDFVFFKADHPDSSLMIMWIFFVNEMEHAISYLYSPYIELWTCVEYVPKQSIP